VPRGVRAGDVHHPADPFGVAAEQLAVGEEAAQNVLRQLRAVHPGDDQAATDPGEQRLLVSGDVGAAGPLAQLGAVDAQRMDDDLSTPSGPRDRAPSLTRPLDLGSENLLAAVEEGACPTGCEEPGAIRSEHAEQDLTRDARGQEAEIVGGRPRCV